jgi:hypothetical protein
VKYVPVSHATAAGKIRRATEMLMALSHEYRDILPDRILDELLEVTLKLQELHLDVVEPFGHLPPARAVEQPSEAQEELPF